MLFFELMNQDLAVTRRITALLATVITAAEILTEQLRRKSPPPFCPLYGRSVPPSLMILNCFSDFLNLRGKFFKK